MTFISEQYQDGGLWLCTLDLPSGDVKKIARFESLEAVKSFWEVLALAKAAAHAHGQGGI